MNSQNPIKLIMIFLITTSLVSAQNKSKIGVNEIESYYSENYKTPSSINFVLSGNPKYIQYFYSDLEKEIKKKFKKKIEISLEYKGEKKHYQSKDKNNNNEYSFYLNITNSELIDEKNGYDRIMRFNFDGQLKHKDSITFSFKTIIYVIHDINNNNENVAKYLIDKLIKD